MASSDTPDSKLDIEEDPASASFMQKNTGVEPGGGEEGYPALASFMQKNIGDEPGGGEEEEDLIRQNSKRPQTLTEKG